MADCGVISFWSTLFFREFSKLISCQSPVIDLYVFYRMEGQKDDVKSSFPSHLSNGYVLFLLLLFLAVNIKKFVHCDIVTHS